jgi:hypothetical protein
MNCSSLDFFSGKLIKKLLGRNDIEDALKKLDTFTTEEAWMATAETLKVTNRVDKMDDMVNRMDDKVDKVDDKVTVLIDGGQTAFLIISTFLNKDMVRCERSKHSYTPFREYRR